MQEFAAAEKLRFKGAHHEDLFVRFHVAWRRRDCAQFCGNREVNMRPSTVESYTSGSCRRLVHIQSILTNRLGLDGARRVACFSPYHFHRIFRGVAVSRGGSHPPPCVGTRRANG